jgi:hypothetical protein
MIVLYAVARQVLQMNIFANVGGSGTLQIVDGLLQKTFVLAITALCLAVLAYVANLFVRHRLPSKKSRVELIDATLDRSSSEYKSIQEDGHSKIRRRTGVSK